MNLLTKDKITDIFCITDDFCKEYSEEIKSHKKLPNPDGKKAVIAVTKCPTAKSLPSLCSTTSGVSRTSSIFIFSTSAYICLRSFPKQLSYNRFIAIEHKVFAPMMLFLNIVCFGECTGISFVDSTKISVCHNKRIFNHKTFDGFAKREKSTMGWFYGFKLHFICNEKGEILSFYFSAGNTDDRDVRIFEVLKKKLFGKLYGDKGYVSQSLFEMLFNQGIHIVAGLKSNMKTA